MITRLFPVWALVFSLAAFMFPSLFTPFKDWIVPLLGIVMLGMGMTLTVANFKAVYARPFPILSGVVLQFAIMPLLAWLIATLLDLPLQLAAGLILVGCSPGGTASNVICYLARGDVALSITLTTVTTILAVFATPFLMWSYAHHLVEVQVLAMFISIFEIVILPVVIGVWINTHVRAAWLVRVKSAFPVVSVIAIVFIIAIIVALNSQRLVNLGAAVVLAVVLHNTLGLMLGYLAAKALRLPEAQVRTLAIEVGMQNSGLAVALAIKYVTPLAALPGAIFSIWHNLSGALLAGYWRQRR